MCPLSRRAKPEHENRKEDVRAPESALLSCQPGTAKPRAGQRSLVCWRHLPWKPKALGPGPLRFLNALVLPSQTWGPTTLPGLLLWPPSLLDQTLGTGAQNPTFLLEDRGPSDQPGDGSDCSSVVRLGVENAVQRSSNWQLRAPACRSEAKHTLVKLQLSLSFTFPVYKGGLTGALFVK